MMRLEELTDGVYACLQTPGEMGYSNSGLVRTGSGLVVDTFFDLAHTRQLIQQYSRVWKRPAAQLVNTHHNGDHCWGNQLLPGAEIIGHSRCAQAMARENPQLLQQIVKGPLRDPALRDLRDRLAPFDFSGIEITPPGTVFDDALVLETCETPIHLRYVGPAHTAGDVIVHLPEKHVVFVGDIVFKHCTPFGWEGSYASWMAALDVVLALKPDLVVPGHGPLCGVDGVQEMKAYLQYVYAESRRHYDAGRTPLAAAMTIDLGPYASWCEAERLVFNVERAYAEFAGGSPDAAFDVLKRFRDMHTLRCYWDSCGAK